MGYIKNIAVIRGIKSGFSADGGALSGIIKIEKYGAKIKIDISYINFAPLTEGKYVCAVSDGERVQILDEVLFEGESNLNLLNGFSALVCYVKSGVYPIASACCGNFRGVPLQLKGEVEKEENLKAEWLAKEEKLKNSSGGAVKKEAQTVKNSTEKELPPDKNSTEKEGAFGAQNPVYEDEAIAEVNYYEYETYEDGGALRADKTQEKAGDKVRGNEEAFGAFTEKSGGVAGKKRSSPLSQGGMFYERMKDEIDKILTDYPAEKCLEEMIDDSKWVRITYGAGGFYVFGMLFAEGKPKYICYGVPTVQSETPPESMEGLASFIPASKDSENKGYWVMYQDAKTGASIKVTSE